MSLHAPTARRERILAYGQSGSGKTTLWLAIAEWIYKTKSPAKMYVIDTDRAWEAHRPLDGHLDGIVIAFDILAFDDYRAAVNQIRERGGRDDWFIHDLADSLWDESQEAYVEKIYGEELDEFFLAEKKIGGDYGKDWAVIKKMYNRVAILYSRFPGHVLACAGANKVVIQEAGKKINPFADDPGIVQKYGRIGFEPRGRAGLAHAFHTEIFTMAVKVDEDYRMTTLKDRKPFGGEGGREYMAGKRIPKEGGFVTGYLVPIAGWKMA